MPKTKVFNYLGAPRASWNPEPLDQKARLAHHMPCAGKVKSKWNATGACPFFGTIRYDGEVWCKRHHPVTQAEHAAHRLNKMVDELRSIGFLVHSGLDK